VKSTNDYIERQIFYDMGKIDEFYDGKKAQFIVVYTNNILVGFVAVAPLRSQPSQYVVMRLNVKEEYRRQGVGIKFVNCAIDWWKENINKGKLAATIDTSNMTSQTLFAKADFEFDSWYFENTIQKWSLNTLTK
jgi:RimJ/RimL family protein N-acetyltransferase